jgi:hypothetical protein
MIKANKGFKLTVSEMKNISKKGKAIRKEEGPKFYGNIMCNCG